ncbi:MAG: type II/IV secretion system protein [Candidatus Liptonbacteria bacterium]|nr:type II/IV secretion system protein [Candidatus Liptonbacteria bacterium]
MLATESKVKKELENGEALSIVSLIDHLIEHAHKVAASDIHLDFNEKLVRVRLRIDGILQDTFVFPKSISYEVISRIKVLSGLRTDEHQTPQDGRFRIIIPDAGPVDVRVSIVPAYHGENAVLRLLSDKVEQFDLGALGFSKNDQSKIMKAIKKPSGMILATGPTGSGKTTTLYTLIKTLSTKEVSIITIEDPVEYAIEDIKQIPVNPRIGFTFANGLRSILRQDPNVIMVGEIRDSETAGIAVNTALTGHLLLSTLHTNDAATTLPRLLDMRIEPYLVASTVNIAIGQRLVRKICAACKTAKKLTKSEEASLSENLPKESLDKISQLYYGKGCDLCNSSGYKGRIGINEVLEIDGEIRDAILRKASAAEIKAIAVKNGMTTMLNEGLEKVRSGLTTIAEVMRVVHE